MVESKQKGKQKTKNYSASGDAIDRAQKLRKKNFDEQKNKKIQNEKSKAKWRKRSCVTEPNCTHHHITCQRMIEFNRQTFSFFTAGISTVKHAGEGKRMESNAIKIKSNMMNITIGLS